MQKSLYYQLKFPQLVNKFEETATCPYLEPRLPIQNLFSIFHCLGRSNGSLLVRGFVVHFLTYFFFFTERSLLAPRSTYKPEDHPLSTIRDCVHIFTATLHIWWAGTVQYNVWLYGLDSPVIESRWGEFFRTRPHRAWGLSSLLYNGYRVSFPGINRPGRGVD